MVTSISGQRAAPIATRPVMPTPQGAITAPASAAASTRPCEPGASEAWCLRDATAEADGALRRAYSSALAAGVKRSSLAAIRSDWSRLQKRALKDPQAMLRGYAVLTDELRRQARDARP